jgi:hypothetical protein
MKDANSVRGVKRRRALKIIVGGVTALLVLLAALPLWLPWVLRPALKNYGIQFGAYERIGYLQFRVRDLKAHFPRATLEVKRIEAILTHAWFAWPTPADLPLLVGFGLDRTPDPSGANSNFEDQLSLFHSGPDRELTCAGAPLDSFRHSHQWVD